MRQGEAGASLFVVLAGEAVVTVATPHGAREVRRLAPGMVFGEMSLLTGEPRTATVTAAADDCEAVEITADAFRRTILAHPAALERLAAAVAARSAELSAVREADGPAAAAPEAPKTFLARVRQFLRVPPAKLVGPDQDLRSVRRRRVEDEARAAALEIVEADAAAQLPSPPTSRT